MNDGDAFGLAETHVEWGQYRDPFRRDRLRTKFGKAACVPHPTFTGSQASRRSACSGMAQERVKWQLVFLPQYGTMFPDRTH